MATRVNLIGQEAELVRITTLYFNQEGFEVQQYRSFSETGIVERDQASLWILDMDQPTLRDYENLRSIRRKDQDVPVIITTSSKSMADRVLGLEIGANDYVEKPFDPRELILRAQRLISFTDGRPRSGRFGSVNLQEYTIDEGRRAVRDESREIRLTSKEFDLLMMFAKHTGYALSREQILDAIWGTSSFCNYRVVDDLVRRLRNKMGRLRIETVYGHGYRSCG